MPAYYNEHDAYAAAWLRNLIAADLIAPGDVDERSITDVRAADLAGYEQCHFFAGIGVWSYALRRAGWPDAHEVWTGSCPCQPFSAAGKKAGFQDERHLWPAWSRLIAERGPRTLCGEQVADGDGLAWLDLVQADLEACGYAVGAVVLPAAGLGAPHARHRAFFVADTECDSDHAGWPTAQPGGGTATTGRGPHAEPRRRGGAGFVADALPAGRPERRAESGSGPASGRSGSGGMGDADDPRSQGRRERAPAGASQRAAGTAGPLGELADADGGGREGARSHLLGWRSRQAVPDAAGPSQVNGFWRDADWLYCRDGKYRPVEPGTFPLAHGAPARVGRLRAYGNAINAEVAEAFIAAYMSARP